MILHCWNFSMRNNTFICIFLTYNYCVTYCVLSLPITLVCNVYNIVYSIYCSALLLIDQLIYNQSHIIFTLPYCHVSASLCTQAHESFLSFWNSFLIISNFLLNCNCLAISFRTKLHMYMFKRFSHHEKTTGICEDMKNIFKIEKK